MESSLKKCNKCLRVLEISCFHKKNDSRDGLRNHCKDCRKKEYVEYLSRPGKKEIAKNRVYRWRKTEKGKKSAKRTKKKYLSTSDGKIKNRTYSSIHRKKFPDRVVARKRLWWAVSSGKIIRPTSCEKCGSNSNIEAHHHKGYDKRHWYDVMWLCRECHVLEDLICSE